ncbi:MAG: mechanosensitive ion channel [Burkholderiales bacterium]|nr:mechanosensitive ion channel [Burkholderiales bacterium]
MIPARALLAVACLLLPGPGALAQVPALPGLVAPAAKAAAPAKPAEQAGEARLAERLAAARAELARIQAPGGFRAGAPPGTPEFELAERRDALRDLVRAYEAQVQARERLADAKRERAAAEAAQRDWTGFAEKPPYSILFVESLRVEVASAESKVRALEAREALVGQFDESTVLRAKQAEARARQLTERAEAAKGKGAGAERLAWQRDLALLEARAVQAQLAAFNLTQQRVAEELAAARVQRAFAQAKLAAASADYRFTAEDLAKVRANLDAEARDLRREIDIADGEAAAWRGKLAAAEKALEAARSAPPRKGETPQAAAARAAGLEREVELARAELEGAVARAEGLRQQADAVRARGALWEQRFKYAENPSTENRQELVTRTRNIARVARAWSSFLEQQLATMTARIRDVDARLAAATDAGEADMLRQLREVMVRRADDLRRALGPSELAGSLAARILEELGAAEAKQGWTDRAEDALGAAWLAAKSAWDFELFAVEDTLEIDGEQVTGKTSVTVGKVLRAIALLVVGYWVARLAGRLGQRIAVRQFGVDPGLARILRRWLFALGMAVLFVVVLIWVRIPLTAFAFLGGAVAIGVGFGMQNMVKNLISGLMVIGERPFRIGDFVEVGGVRGTVTNVGLRSSTLRDVNGIETLIPNATFVEQNLTNWTLTSREVRFAIKVGVAYGSPVKDVEKLLLEAAGRHGLVLAEPPPEVAFEDFGSDALHFTLYYWLDLKPEVLPRRVATDLRYMIEKSFGEAGIVIAYPQRDVHVDVASPLEVRVVAPSAGEAPSAAERERPVRPVPATGPKG